MYTMYRLMRTAPIIGGIDELAANFARQLHMSARNNVQTTQVLCGEPLKKKKRLDPAIVRMQLERRKKRLEKQIRRAQKFGRKLKPIDEFELHREVDKKAPPRANESVIELAEGDPSESSVIREWVAHRISQHNKLHGKFSEMILSQERALHELKLANRQLYDLAVQKDADFLPYSFVGPCETPPIPGYIQDGVYTETTKSYELDPEIVKLMLDKNSNNNKK